MGRKKVADPKVPLTVSVKRTTKESIRSEDINAGELLDNMFGNEDSKS